MNRFSRWGKISKSKRVTQYISLRKRGEDDFYISGNQKYCPTPTKCSIHGSTWGGSMLKMGFVGRGMHLEFSTQDHRVPIITSMIAEIVEQ